MPQAFQIEKRLLVLGAFFISASCWSQEYFTPLANQCHRHVIQLDFEQADSLLPIAFFEEKENLYLHVIQSKLEFLKIFLSEDNSLVEPFEIQEEIRRNIISKMENDSLKNIFLSELYLQQALLELKFANYFSSARWLFKTKNKCENNPKVQAIIDGITGTVPSKYQWLLRTVGFKGNLQTGKRLLENYSNNNWKEEAQYVLGFYNLFLAHDTLPNLEHSTNTSTLLYLFQAHLKNDGNTVIENGSNLVKAEISEKMPYIKFLLGRAFINANHSHGVPLLNEYLKENNGPFHNAKAHLLLYEYAQLNNIEYTLDTILEIETLNDGDNFIKTIVKEELLPSRQLIEAKHLQDFGLEDSALQLLKSINTSKLNKYEQQEYWYRLGKLDTINTAIHLNKSFEIETDILLYYPIAAKYELAKSCLERKPELAKLLLKEILDSEDFAYKRSFDQKAEALLSRLH